MSKVLLVVSCLFCLAFIFLGCSSRVEEGKTTDGGSTTLVQPSIKVTQITQEIKPPIIEGYTPPVDINWLYPSSVDISNFHYGARAEYEIMVHNGSVDTVIFSLSVRPADTPSQGFEKAPFAFFDWVKVQPKEIRMAPKSTEKVLISLQMTSEYTVPSKWEFWLAVIDNSQVGMLRTELCERWRVSMK